MYKQGTRYASKFMVEGKNHHLGTFDTPEAAGKVYQRARKAMAKGRLEAFCAALKRSV